MIKIKIAYNANETAVEAITDVPAAAAEVIEIELAASNCGLTIKERIKKKKLIKFVYWFHLLHLLVFISC